MPISADLLEILACPETKRPVHLAEDATIRRLGDRPAEGLLTEHGRRLYPIRNDIPAMLIDQAIVLDEPDE